MQAGEISKGGLEGKGRRKWSMDGEWDVKGRERREWSGQRRKWNRMANEEQIRTRKEGQGGKIYVFTEKLGNKRQGREGVE